MEDTATYQETSSYFPRIGLALGGGGARGYAHIGVLRAITEARLPIYCIAGTSMGAVVAAAYAAGSTVDDMAEVALAVHWRWLLGLADPTIPRRGAFTGKRLARFFDELTKGKDFTELSIPLCIVATDITTGEEVRITSGRVSAALRASTALPGILCPVERGAHLLVDGSITTPVPVSAAVMLGADIVIGVDVSSDVGRAGASVGTFENWATSSPSRLCILSPNSRLPTIAKSLLPESLAIIGRSLQLSGQVLEKVEAPCAQIWRLRPQVGHVGWYDLARARHCIQAGEDAGNVLVERIRTVSGCVGQITREAMTEADHLVRNRI